MYTEGSPNQIIVTKYERNPHARKVCILHHGLSCIVWVLILKKLMDKLERLYSCSSSQSNIKYWRKHK